MGSRIIFPAQGEVSLRPCEPRAPDTGEVQVRTLYSLMSIGTETTILHAKYAPGTHFASRFSFPQMKTGVQSLAVIEALVPLRAFTLRLQQRCVGEVTLILRTAPRRVFLPASALSFLVVLRHLKQDLYYSYLRGETGAETLLEFVERGMSEPFDLPDLLGANLRGYLFGLSRRRREGSKRKEALLQQAQDEDRTTREEAAYELQCLERARKSPGMLRELADFIEFAEALSWESPA